MNEKEFGLVSKSNDQSQQVIIQGVTTNQRDIISIVRIMVEKYKKKTMNIYPQFNIQPFTTLPKWTFQFSKTIFVYKKFESKEGE